MDLGIDGKAAIVLGASSGIGRGIAEALAAEGVTVALAARRADHLEKLAASIVQGGGRAIPIPLDLGSIESVENGFARAQDALGRVDILVNNSGGPPPGGVSNRPLDLWREQFEAMVLSIIHISDLALPGMLDRKWGRIITIGSAGVIQPIPSIGLSNALRGTLAGWSKTLAGEVAVHGVTVNMLHPASTVSDRIRGFWQIEADRSGRSIDEVAAQAAQVLPTGRHGSAEEFGAVAAFIASQHAAYITGSMIRVDGGFISAL